MKKITSIFLSLIAFNFAWSQDQSFQTKQEQIIEKAIFYAEEEEYLKAALELERVNENDSSYFDIISSASYYFLLAEEYNKCIELCDKGIKHSTTTSKHYFYLNKIAALSRSKENKKAIETATLALEIYPKSYSLLFNRAISLEETGDIIGAINDLKTSIQINPFHEKSHLRLALLCSKQNQTAQAILCLNTYLILNPESEYSSNILSLANEIASRRSPSNEKPIQQAENEDFEEINLILNNKVALSKKYKTKNKIRSSFSVQSHILLEQLKSYNKKDGFWNQKYVPLFKWIAKNNYYNAMVYTTHISAEYYKHKSIAIKNVGIVKSFLSKFYENWGDIAGKETIIDKNGNKKILNYIYEDFILSAIGEMKEDKAHGDWVFYDENGAISSYGRFDHDKREGLWTLQNDKGETLKEINYYNNERHGEFLLYKNNILYQKANFKHGEVDGEVINYSPRGAIAKKMNYKDGILDGDYSTFFKNGTSKNYELTYLNDTANGTINYYFKNGALYSTLELKNNMRNGLEKTFYSDSAIYSELNYKNNLLDGEQKYYFHNGKISSTGQAKEGEYEGEWKDYYIDGTLESTTPYNKGEIDGILTSYNKKGEKESEYTYKKGNFIGYQYFDKNGNIILQGKKQNGNFMFNSINPNGEAKTSGLYNVKGGKTGEWKYYTRNGVLKSSEKYSNEGLLEGTSYNYFHDGTVSTESTYKNDTLNGSYYSYYSNGKTYEKGYYKDGLLEGEWTTYYINGNKKNISYYNSGKLNGKSIHYTVDGYKTEINYFFDDVLYKQNLYYDTTNNSITIEAPFDSLSYDIEKYLDGNIKSKATLKYNYLDGDFTHYYPKGATNVKGYFLNGSREGKWTWFHENGKVKTIGEYRLGDKHGKWLYYHENGKLETEKDYILGKINGNEKTYNSEGLLIRESQYYYGELNGYRKFYSEDGHLQLIRYYENDYLIGYSYLDQSGKEIPMVEIKNETAQITSYFDNGNIARELNITKGEFNGPYKEYYYSGQLAETQTYKNTLREGEYIIYYPNGKVKEQSFYENDLIQGEKKYYYPNGTIKQISNYIGDYLVGEEYYFNEKGEKTKTLIYFNDEVIDEK